MKSLDNADIFQSFVNYATYSLAALQLVLISKLKQSDTFVYFC